MEPNLDTLRFSFRRKIGSGAMGEVYEGFDHQRKMPLALKRLHHVDASGLVFLKNEFRSLADIAHPNLVTLHDLVADDNGWFFTMELVLGVPFQRWVRGSESAAPTSGSTSSTAVGRTFQEIPAAEEEHSTIDDHTFATPGPAPARDARPAVRGTAPADLDRLRAAYRQLAEGVHALHRARRLHRDLKPSNVLVEESGRVVILDFGLVLDLDADGARRLPAAGTAAYMSPEQARRAPLGPPSDWYAFGTMLYESLTGHRPFEGQIARVLADKQTVDPVAPDQVADGLPDDLVALCVGLLERDPARRPNGAEVVTRLGGRGEAIEVETELVGRETHRGQLREAWRAARLGQPRLVQIRGRSGMGKSSLVEGFLAEARAQGTVLSGRCYERESVPYKAFDSLLDAVAGILHGWTDERVKSLGVADLQALARLFPALGRVDVIRDLPDLDIPDPQELRRRASDALVNLLLALAPVAVFVDDVQWADRDSAVLFRHLLGVRGAVLLIVAWREEDSVQSAFLASMERASEGASLPIDAIRVGELSPADAALLASRLAPEATPEMIEGIARESGGSPMFVAELARAAGSRGAVDLDGAIQERVGRLPVGARRLAELLAVSGRPTPPAVLGAATGGDWLTDLAQLRAGRLARSSGDRIEAYHDRVREAIAGGLAEDARRACHRALAEAYELFSVRDPDLMLVHLDAAGLPVRAAPYALLAAARAESALAFEHAARLYRIARGLKHWSGDELRAIDRSLADSLASAGRGVEAADAFAAATAGEPDPGVAANLRKRAAEELLQAGHVDRGREAFRAALADVGNPMAPDGAAAIASLVWQKARMAVRGRGWKPRATPLDDSAGAAIDLCWSASRAFAFIDYLQSADLGTRTLRLALDAGDPMRVARALILESGQTAASGGPANAAAAKGMLAEAEAIALRSGDPNLEGHVLLGQAIAAYMDEHWRECVDLAVRAEDVLLNRCRRASWELAQCRLFQLWSRVWLGQLDVLARDYERMLEQAEERGNLFSATNLRADIGYLVHVMRDDPAGGEVAVAEVENRWSRSGFHLQHYNFAISRSLLALYRGEGAAAMEILAGMVRKFRWSLLSTSGILKMEVAHMRARTAWSVCAASTSPPRAALAQLRSALKELDGIGVPGAEPQRFYFRGVLALLGGDRAAAIRHTEAALARFEALEYHLHAAAMRRHAGLLAGDPERVAQAEGWLAGMGVVNPGALCRMYSGADPRLA